MPDTRDNILTLRVAFWIRVLGGMTGISIVAACMAGLVIGITAILKSAALGFAGGSRNLGIGDGYAIVFFLLGLLTVMASSLGGLIVGIRILAALFDRAEIHPDGIRIIEHRFPPYRIRDRFLL